MCVDWSQFLPSMIATFVGFVLALLGQWLFLFFVKTNNSHELIEHIVEELTNIKIDLEKFSCNSLDIQPLKTPVWNAVINAGQVALLDTKMREQLFSVYNAVQEFNSWCLVQTNYYFENERFNTLLTTELKKLKEEMLLKEVHPLNRSVIIAIHKLNERRK